MKPGEIIEGAWLKEPDVMLLGSVARRFTVMTDGETSRLKNKQPFNDNQEGGVPAWPQMRAGRDSPWPQPLPVSLAPHQTLVTDGERGWVKDKTTPEFDEEQQEQEDFDVAEPTPVCIPADVDSVVIDPFEDPLSLGSAYTFTAFGVTGTEPITYQWYIKSSGVFTLRSTSATFHYTLSNSDVEGKDEFGLGKLFIYVVVKNACNEGGTSTNVDGSYNAQGTPP